MFYTYAHYTPDNTVFYIGKGKGSRAYEVGRNDNWNSVFEKHKSFKVEILANWETEKEAFEHEVFLIQCFREMGFNLCNLTDGGEGSSGWKHSEAYKSMMKERFTGENNHFFGKSHSEESKLKVSKSKLGSTGPWLGKPRDEDTKRKISLSLLGRQGRPHTTEAKAKIAASKIGKKMKPVSDKTRFKLSEAIKKSWANRKQSLKGE